MRTLKEICLANGAIDAKLDAVKSGDIVVANAQAAGFAVPLQFSQALTAFSAGLVGNMNSAELQKFIAPHMRTPKNFEYAVSDRLDAFDRPKLAQMRRARGGEYPYAGTKTELAKGSLSDFGLAVKIDKDDYSEEFQRAMLERLQRMINDALLEGTIDMLDAMAVSTEISLAALGDTTTLDAAIADELEEARKLGGIMPNRILFGGTAWSMRKKYYESKALAGSTLAFPRTAADFTQDIRAKTEIMDALTVSDTGALEMLAGNTIYAFYGQDAPGLDDPSNMKTAFGGEDHVYTGQNEQGTLHVLAVGTNKELLPVCPKGVVKIVLTD